MHLLTCCILSPFDLLCLCFSWCHFFSHPLGLDYFPSRCCALLSELELALFSAFVCSDSETDKSGMTFREHRRAHYDEFLKVRELRKQGSLLEEVEEDAEYMDKDDGARDSSSSLSAGVKDIEIEDGTVSSSGPPAKGD